MTRTTRLIAAVLSAATLAACGETRADRAISGAGIGAAGGAAVGAAAGGLGVIPGALIGAGVGAAAGGLTTSSDVNLGRPVWQW